MNVINSDGSIRYFLASFFPNTNQMKRPTEFPYFPHSIWRPNPPFLNGSVGKTDPWQRVDDWRYHEFFSANNRLKRIFPGLGCASILLAGYIAFDKWYHNDGPGKQERLYWENWTSERNQRLHHHK
jgi:hypothetical protein